MTKVLTDADIDFPFGNHVVGDHIESFKDPLRDGLQTVNIAQNLLELLNSFRTLLKIPAAKRERDWTARSGWRCEDDKEERTLIGITPGQKNGLVVHLGIGKV